MIDYKKEFESLLDRLIAENGSDLHLSVGKPPIIRISGFLVPFVNKSALTPDDTEAFMELLLRPDDKKVLMSNKDVDFSYDYKGRARFRGNCFFQQGSLALSLRLIPRRIRTLAELNLPPILQYFAEKQQGFFLVVGPMGHGKSTTLASMIELINQTRAEHILTIEDPIEYVYEPKLSVIEQREVRIDTPDFATALRSAFRQDANVILVGEMRDLETISNAIIASDTGHLVFSTLHTNSASQTINRIIDVFPSNQQDQIRIQLASSLTGIFSQRLIPRISGGLIPAYELLINNSAVANLIREKRIHEINTIIETSSENGMIDMNRSLADLVRRGEITPQNAYMHSLNPKVLEKLIK
jgi:twitching motility protein PilT